MAKILVGSKNPVKVKAVEETFSRFFPEPEVMSFSVPSGVPDQPRGDEILRGCRNRAIELKRINEERKLGADFFVGMEAGMTKMESSWFNFSGACIIDKDGKEGYGTSPFFQYPEIVLKRLLEGEELGVVADEVLGEHNSKQKGGMVGHFTKGAMDRKSYIGQSLIIALVPFLNRELFFKE
ncbi:MAG: inosine/xanthosine triphosphatase [archaeon]|nr:MAG: inosine/xanthosine triphosphatase [archaeon]